MTAIAKFQYSCLIVLMSLSLAVLGCQNSSGSRGLSPQAEDYAVARKTFKTKLLRSGPAPQESSSLQPPAGVDQINYSKPDHLKAWISTNASNSSKMPAVLFLHGGFAFGADDWESTKPFRDAGFIVMTPLLRGENGQSGNYSMFYDEVTDVLSALDVLIATPGVDKKRIFLAGHSVGGTLTMLTALTTKKVRGAASFSGSPDQISWSQGQPEVIPFDPASAKEFQMRSPIAYPGSFKCPTRLFYGDEETIFSDVTERLAVLAQGKHLDVKAIKVSGNHFTALPEEFRKSIDFFKSL